MKKAIHATLGTREALCCHKYWVRRDCKCNLKGRGKAFRLGESERDHGGR